MADEKGRFPTARHAGSHFPLALVAGGTQLEGRTVPEFLLAIVQYLDSRSLLSKVPIPFATSGNNFLIAEAPRHPSGALFVAHLKYARGGRHGPLFINTNHPRFFALRQGARILKAAGLNVTLPVE